MKNFELFLQKKGLEYGKIDRFRAFALFEKYKNNFKIKPIIQLIGTNGKGSTGRFLAQLLGGLSYKVGHFTSPHLLRFNERFYLSGKIVSDELLVQAHERLESIMKKDLQRLSYFEYATFLAVLLFEKCDFVIFEAGMGGEFDSTSLFEKELSIFTNIDFDHKEMLGTSLRQIARTKLKAMGKKALILSRQSKIVLNQAFKTAFLKNSQLFCVSEKDQPLLQKGVKNYVKKFKIPNFLKENLFLASFACALLVGEKKSLKALENLPLLDLRGRMEQIRSNLYIDVGHNPLAARVVANFFKGKKICLIYNSFLDKDIFEILRILKPIIAIILVFEYESARKLANERLFTIAKELNLKCQKYNGMQDDETYLVFGSFLLVEAFLRKEIETT